MLRFLFYPSFFLLFLVSFFLIEGDQRFYLFAFWSIFLCFFTFKFLRQDKKTASNRYTISALVMALLFSINIFFSTIPSLTLEKLLFYLLALALFIFFNLMPDKKFNKSSFFYYLTLSSLVLNAFVLFFTFVEVPPNLFPSMNLLVKVFGHNYYVSYLLLALPIFWWQFLFAAEQKFISHKEMRILSLILILSSYFIMIFSLSRISMFVGFLQLVLIFWSNKASFIKLLHNQFAYVIVQVFSLVLLVLVALFAALPSFFSGQADCPLKFSYKEMCKPILQNDRLQYWQKAFWVWQTSPIFGTGLKTFGFSSRQFVLENYNFSSYAHNNFFHNLAEGGLVTGLPFMALILYFLWRAFKVVLRDRGQGPLLKFLFLAVSASFFNAMFDLTWNFFVIFALTLIFLALILREEKSSSASNSIYLRYLNLISLLSVFLALSYFFASVLFNSGKNSQLVKFFPFFDQHIRNSYQDKRLDSADFAKVYYLYRFDPDFIYNYSRVDGLDQAKKAELLIELGKLDPIYLLKKVKFEEMSYQSAKPLVAEFTKLLVGHQILNNLEHLDYWQQRNMAIDFFHFGNQAYRDNNPQVAVFFYQQAKLLNPFIMGEMQAAFLSTEEVDRERLLEFLKVYADAPAQDMGRYFYDYMEAYQKTLLYLFNSNRMSEFFSLTEKILEKEPNFSWFLWRKLIEASQTKEEKQRLEQVYKHFKNLETWSDFLPLPI